MPRQGTSSGLRGPGDTLADDVGELTYCFVNGGTKPLARHGSLARRLTFCLAPLVSTG